MIRAIDDEALWEYAAELSSFVGDGKWSQFMERLGTIGYSESEVVALDEALNKRAGRSW